MKAVVYHQYGSPDVLHVAEVAKPQPKDNQVLVKVHAAAVNFADWGFLRGDPLVMRLMQGLRRPKNPILGADLAGTVEAVGAQVTQFRPGDAVYGDLGDSGLGSYAEYVAAPQNTLALKPANLSFEQAAAVPQASVVALQSLRDKGQIRPGHKVLIAGASGGIGTFAVQMAKYFGAEVTGVCSTRNLALVRSLGADHVIDYTKADFARGEQRYDLILATAGYRSIFDYRRALAPKGIYVVSGGAMGQIFQGLLIGPFLSMLGGQKMGSMLQRINQADLNFVRGLIEAGSIQPVIDQCYPMAEAAEALRHYGTGHARGKVVISMA